MRRIIFGNDSAMQEPNLINTKYAVGIVDVIILDIHTFTSNRAFQEHANNNREWVS